MFTVFWLTGKLYNGKKNFQVQFLIRHIIYVVGFGVLKKSNVSCFFFS